MKKVLVLLLLSILLYGADRTGLLAQPKNLLEKALSLRIILNFPPSGQTGEERERLKKENLELLAKIIDQKKLLAENEALRIQLGAKKELAESLSSQKLLPARVLSLNIPFLIIDKGKEDGVMAGMNAVYKNILVGQVSQVSEKRARIELVTRSGNKILAKTERGALGVVFGQGGGMLLDNVPLSENLEEKDLVLTAGSLTNEKGEETGFLPNLLIGKISEVFKKEGALFQQAQILILLDFRKLEIVFLVI